MNNTALRFLKYVNHATASSYKSKTCPSTSSQMDFAMLLADECRQMGLQDVSVDKNGYLYACLPSNTAANTPIIGFIAHMDVSPDAPDKNIKPNIITNYNGEDIVLKGITLSPAEFPSLLNYKGQTLITTDGTTLLGADDKAGIAEILSAMEYLISHPEVSHGCVKIAFTPDEEIGKGADLFDVSKFGADFAFTVDGGRLGELEYENFNAARANIKIKGKGVHPGTAKDIMVNACLIASEIASALPKNETPQTTEGYEGFFHLHCIKGDVSNAKLSYLIRDFDDDSFATRKALLESIVADKNIKYNNCISLEIHDEYYNMISQIKNNMEIITLAEKAMLHSGVTPIIQPIRGGTDGARLSFMGLACPNIFTGGHNFHGEYEFIPVESMQKAVDVIISIIRLNAKI